jgi:hypothetical protein
MTTKTPRKLSRLHKPDDMSLETWQRELRRQFGREQAFALKNVGAEPVFSEDQVTRALQAIGSLLDRFHRTSAVSHGVHDASR